MTRSIWLSAAIVLLGLSLTLWVVSVPNIETILPKSKQIKTQLLQKPIQELKKYLPFKLYLGRKVLDVKPVGEINLSGLVVARGKQNFWQTLGNDDFLDLCLIWGDNLRTDRYLRNEYFSDSGKCYAKIGVEDLMYFDRKAISNNHLLMVSKHVREVAKGISVGDQIQIKGKLIDYKSPSTKQWIKTSVTRSDIGDRSCEIILLQNIKLIKKAAKKTGLKKAVSRLS